MTEPYLDMAAEMRPLVEKDDGFLSVERFPSLTNPGKLLSVSFFRDKSALDAGRKLTAHRRAQSAGGNRCFKDYRLRIAPVIRDYGKFDRDDAPDDSRALNG